MNKRLTSLLFLYFTFIISCVSTPKMESNDVVPAPQMAWTLEDELAKVISPSHCRILGCVNRKMDPDHYICTGEYSLILPSRAHEKFRVAANNVIVDNIRIDFTADEGVGSQLLAAFFQGVGGGMAAGAFGGRGSFYYAGSISSAPVQFTLPEKREIH